jgi:Ser/Thr protein kinase RdoA (MazF antagonist)
MIVSRQLEILLEIAEKAVAQYALPHVANLTMINLSENATYKVEAVDGQCWALRIHREGYQSKAAIASELAWLMALRETGVVVTPKPVKGIDGEFIQIVGHAELKHSRFVVLSEWESGAEPNIAQDLLKPFEILGEQTARMHKHSRHWKRPDYFTRLTWDFETSLGEDKPHWGRWRDGIGVHAESQKVFGRTVDVIKKRLKAYGKSSERFGLIHGDLRLANLLIDGSNVKVIDFDDCGFGWLMYDAATPVSFYEHEPQVPDLIEAWKVGYRKSAVLAKEDEDEIPTFVMLRRLLLVAWIGSRPETELAKSMGQPYSDGTMGLCESYLRKFE